MTTAVTFSHQNDAGSRVSGVILVLGIAENLVLVVVIVSEFKALGGECRLWPGTVTLKEDFS